MDEDGKTTTRKTQFVNYFILDEAVPARIQVALPFSKTIQFYEKGKSLFSSLECRNTIQKLFPSSTCQPNT